MNTLILLAVAAHTRTAQALSMLQPHSCSTHEQFKRQLKDKLAWQALSSHISESLPQRSMAAPVQAAEIDRDAVLRTLKGLVADILGTDLPESEPFMEVRMFWIALPEK